MTDAAMFTRRELDIMSALWREGSGAAGRHALGRVVDKIFHGSAELALARLVSGRKLDPAEADRMKKLIDEATEAEGLD